MINVFFINVVLKVEENIENYQRNRIYEKLNDILELKITEIKNSKDAAIAD